MKKNEYTKIIDDIKAMPGVKETIWKNLITKKETGTSIRKWKYMAAGILGLCVLTCSLPTAAEGIRSLLMREVPHYESLTESVETNIFRETDGHIQVDVEELLSDGMAVYMTVKYTAIDDIGKQWLNEYELKQIAGIFDISLNPDMGDMTVNKTNYSYGTIELTDRATENERLFFLKMESSSRDYLSGNGIFTFPLTNGPQKAILDISGNIEIHSYELSNEESPSELYTPSFIEISPMSFVIYAHNHGVFERETDGDYSMERWLMPPEEINALEKNSYFIMSDGRKEILPPGGHTTTYPKPENLNSDVVLYYGLFLEYGENNQITAKTIDPAEIDAVIINGVRYEFE